MFKDIYKSANESIDTDEVFERISKKIHEKKPAKNYKIYYGIAAAAACAVIVCAVIFNVQFENNQNVDIQVAKSSPVNESVKQQPVTEMPAAPQQETDEMPAEGKTEEKSAVRFEPQISEKQTQTENSTVENKEEGPQAEPDETVEKKHEPTPIRIVMKINKAVLERSVMSASAYSRDLKESADVGAYDSDSEEETPKPVLRSSGGAAQMKTEAPKELSYDEYCDYIGCDIKVKIPNFADTSAEFSGIYKNPDGSIPYDAYTFSFEKDGAYLYITPTKDLTAVKSYLDSTEYEKSLFGETDTVITQHDDVYNAYFVKGDTAYTVMLGNSSEDELKNVILELIQ